MSKVILNTNTELRRTPGTIGVYSYYVQHDKNLSFFISNTEKTINDIPFKQGEMGYINNDWINTYFFLNERGELVVISNDVTGFEINVNGELEYTENE